ncbi:hypothetical protein ZWY2020_054739 [Hordeum vulgare]|nr:hypothetical protein ZWY2020_054739 [Hordeum vulgare]
MPAAPAACELRFRCSVCGKAFPSHQALGGHWPATGSGRCSLLQSVSPAEETVSSSTSSGVGRHRVLRVPPEFRRGRRARRAQAVPLLTGCRCRLSASASGSASSVRGFDLNLTPVPEKPPPACEYGRGGGCRALALQEAAAVKSFPRTVI